MTEEPISTIFETIGDLFLLITKALPSDEQKLAAFKLRAPKKYARIRTSIIDSIVKYCRKHKYNVTDASNYTTLETDDLPTKEQDEFVKAVIAQLVNN